ncbi:Na(+)-translocating NADH-quinone reductase subunit F [Algibacter sp.]|nr:Na(+)-translocating NADH-quinone reductase subunit F [Algibacter sp.]MDB4273974.1 Na(+)-translocating NADH-quinone reductase subunit F [Algibacter sp.]MDC1379352.1 Na(+)-translocating NADH-quinone reductase subunit F [Algibacter sp.]
MKTTPRLESALKKLYTAFHGNTLNPECCKQCAVGNILDQTNRWKHLSDSHGGLELNYVGRVHQNLGRKFNGYSPLELLKIENVFLNACGYQLPLHYKNKKPQNPTSNDVLYNGLVATISFLCELDGVSNVMDYTRLFEFAKYKLELC